MSIFIENMNTNQRKAVENIDGAVMIIAGAGSGKTRVLTNRIAYLIAEKNIYENKILAITFTNKAAKEMKNRIYDLVGESTKYIWINTFHSMCVRILREHIELLGYNKTFTILDSGEQKVIIKNILKELNFNEDNYDVSAILKIISNSKNKNITPEELKNNSKFQFMKNVSEVYLDYNKYLKRNSVLDFDDLLLKTIELFLKFPEVLRIYQNKFEYIHVDEYQDTNYIQYQLLKLLSNVHKNICVVGDDDQSIYSWRGACVENIKNFEKDFSNIKIIFLEQNYRSNNTILSAANSIIKNNVDRKVKNLWSEKGYGDKINLYNAYNDIDEANNIVKKIKELRNTGINYSDIAILYRANYLSRTIENNFITNSIPYKLIGSLKFLQRKEIKDILSYLNVLVNKDDDFSLKRIINVPKRGIGNIAIDKIEKYARENNISIFQTLLNVEDIGLTKNTSSKIKLLIKLIEKYSEYENYSIDEIILGIYKESGYEDMIKDSKDEFSESREYNVSELISSAKQYSEINNNLLEYISDMSLMSDSDDENKDNAVTLSTVHASKGLEYKVVFIIGMEENIFPSIKDIDDDSNELKIIEEERRLAYVAITRAKDKLFISNTNRRLHFGNLKNNESSRFIAEIPDELIEQEKNSNLISNHKIETSKTSKQESVINNFSPKIKISKESKNVNSNFSVGEKVFHNKFGSGIVENFNDDNITVNFSNYGKKILLIEYANLTKE